MTRRRGCVVGFTHSLAIGRLPTADSQEDHSSGDHKLSLAPPTWMEEIIVARRTRRVDDALKFEAGMDFDAEVREGGRSQEDVCASGRVFDGRITWIFISNCALLSIASEEYRAKGKQRRGEQGRGIEDLTLKLPSYLLAVSCNVCVLASSFYSVDPLSSSRKSYSPDSWCWCWGCP